MHHYCAASHCDYTALAVSRDISSVTQQVLHLHIQCSHAEYTVLMYRP